MRYFGTVIILGVLFCVNANTDEKYGIYGQSHYITRKNAVNSHNIPQAKSISYQEQYKDGSQYSSRNESDNNQIQASAAHEDVYGLDVTQINRMFQQMVSAFLPGFSFDNLAGLFSNISNLVSNIPVFGHMVSQNLQSGLDFIRNFAGSFGNASQIIMSDVRNGYFGEESLSIFRRFVEGIRSFIENIVRFWREQITKPLSVMYGLMNTVPLGNEYSIPTSNSITTKTTPSEASIVPEIVKPLATALGLRKKNLVVHTKAHKMAAKKGSMERSHHHYHQHE